MGKINKECTGIFGKIFGHNYNKYLIYSGVPRYGTMESIHPGYMIDIIEATKEKKYEIRCSRCGEKK